MKGRMHWLKVGQWMLLTGAGVLLAGGFHFPGDFGTRFWSQVVPDWSGSGLGFVFGAVSGLIISGLPALLLPGLGVPARQWIGFNVLAYGLIHAMADAVPYRPLVIWGGGPVLALCQYLALRARLSHPNWWLPLVTVAWWLGFGLTAATAGYNLLVIGLLLGAATGLGLWALLITAPAVRNRWWSRLNQPQRVVAVVGLVMASGLVLFLYAGLTGLTGLFEP
jgi:hypothetical protein